MFFKSILIFVGVILFADLMGFGLWKISGQKPVDNLYLGTLSGHTYQWLKSE